jgi:hypothetical protein
MRPQPAGGRTRQHGRSLGGCEQAVASSCCQMFVESWPHHAQMSTRQQSQPPEDGPRTGTDAVRASKQGTKARCKLTGLTSSGTGSAGGGTESLHNAQHCGLPNGSVGPQSSPVGCPDGPRAKRDRVDVHWWV